MTSGTRVPGPPTAAIEVVMVEAEDCHYCAHAGEVLADLARRYPLDIRRVDLSTGEGSELMRRARAPFPPVLLIGGALFGHGRVSARKLERHLQSLVAVG